METKEESEIIVDGTEGNEENKEESKEGEHSLDELADAGVCVVEKLQEDFSEEESES